MENRNCQNCKKDFIIESDDFGFYEKIKVPPPTFCPRCRFERRMTWRNERSLYKRTCDLCHKNIISTYSANVTFPVYCTECWYGDGWDPISFGRDYDFSKPFFAQFQELMNVVPRFALWQRNSINSDYANMVAESKNVYMSYSIVAGSENVFYSKCVDKSKDIFDSLNIINGSESLYENVEAQNNYNSQYLLLCRSCIDSYYLVDCINCSNCFMSYNLRNKQYCIENKQYTREDYFKELEKFNLKSRISRKLFLKEFDEIKRQAIYRYGNINRAIDSTGNNLLNVKNCKNCFEVYEAENFKYCYRAFTSKDCMDYDFGQTSELMYEYLTGALSDYNVRFSCSAMGNVRDADYTFSCLSSGNLFGCASVKSRNYVILNKVYTKEEFQKLRTQIIEQMNIIPYLDKKGRIYKYGEFFPIEIGPYAYNETLAQEFTPLSKEQCIEAGYSWNEQEIRNFNVTLLESNIPDNVDDIKEDILREVLGCSHKNNCNHQCTTAFRLSDYELKFYKKHNISIPSLCPNCRYYDRLAVMPGLKLYKRECMCDRKKHDHEGKCGNIFETAYAPERPEKIYCESCYNKEVY